MEQLSQRFRVRRDVGKAAVFLVIFGLFLATGIGIWIWTGQIAGLGITGFGMIVLTMMILQISAVGTWYAIRNDRLILKRGATRREFGPNTVLGARILSTQEADAILKSFTEGIMESERAVDVKGWLQSNATYAGFTRFCTVPIVQSRMSAGHQRNVVAFNASTSGRFVLLKVSHQEYLLLSPEDPEAFLDTLARINSLGDPVVEPSSGWAGEVPRADVSRRKRTKRIYVVYSAVSFVFFFSVMGYMYRDTFFQNTKPYTATPTPETGWVGTDSFRVVATSRPVSPNLYPDTEQRKDQIIDIFDREYPFDVTAALMEWHYRETDIYPTGEQREAVHAAVMRVVPNLEAELLKADFDDEMTTLTAWIEVKGENLQERIDNAITEVLSED